jgi:ribosomal protein S12 methylthiotransferase
MNRLESTLPTPFRSPSRLAPEAPAVAILHLGCEKNRVDTEHMLGLLAQAGYRVDGDEESADYVIVNTCSFIEAARRESVSTLMELAVQGKKIVIAGCLAQHFQEELLQEIPEAVAIVGTGDYHQIVQIIERVERGERVNAVTSSLDYIADETVPRYRTTHAPVAYLRVAEGCDYRCSFCIIPHLRGDQRSRSIESILREAEQLAEEGVQELILISQITTHYGIDLYGEPRLADLIRALGKIPIPWIRMLYAYPTGITPAVVEAIQETPNFLPYLDLPLQHSHPQILKAMNRPWQGQVNDRVIERLRQALPNAVLRTSFIVGFPGETEEHFQHLLDFVQRHQFDHVGVFTFSPEEGTPCLPPPPSGSRGRQTGAPRPSNATAARHCLPPQPRAGGPSGTCTFGAGKPQNRRVDWPLPSLCPRSGRGGVRAWGGLSGIPGAGADHPRRAL